MHCLLSLVAMSRWQGCKRHLGQRCDSGQFLAQRCCCRTARTRQSSPASSTSVVRQPPGGWIESLNPLWLIDYVFTVRHSGKGQCARGSSMLRPWAAGLASTTAPLAVPPLK